LLNMNLIKFESVTKKFGDKIPVREINFEIEKGTLTTIIGPNGAGKTTIAKMILGLEQPTSGRIIRKLNISLSYVPQKINLSLSLPITVKGFLNLLSPDHDREKEFTKFAEFIDIRNLAKIDISKLSGGQFQKLLLIANLLRRPDLIVLDEPTQSLDISSQKEFYNLIDNARENNPDLTIFMISHDLFMVMKSSDQVICLNGHICCSGKPNDTNKSQEFINTLSSLGVYNHHHDHKH
ncbi:MAG: ATP-binding cassette domain-containing protein, partial [Janthinobacterium lividum]